MSNSYYLNDLLLRMDSRERLPQTGPMQSSKDSVSWVAHQEAKSIDDVDLLPALKEFIGNAECEREFQKLAIITGHLVRNTGRGSDAFEKLLERAPASDNAWHFILEQAALAKIEAAKPYAIRIIDEPYKQGLALSAAIEFLGKTGTADDVDILCKLLDSNCRGFCHPMYAVFALRNLGCESAIPRLRNTIEKRNGSREQIDQEVVSYAEFAVEYIANRPPRFLSNATVRGR